MIRQYADATNDPNPRYQDGSAVPVAFPVVLVFDAQTAGNSAVPREAIAQARAAVHGEHDLMLHRPLVPGEELEVFSEASSVRITRAGTGVALRIEMRDASGTVVAEQWWTTFFAGIELGEAGGPDPHFWQDPTLVKKSVANIAAELTKVDPGGAAGYEARATDYTAQLDDLDTELKTAYGAVPPERRKMVTDHDAFNYLARRYRITLVGAVIPSLSTAAEPSARETAKLIDTIKSEGVCAVFSESSVDPKLGRQVAEESGATIYPDLYGDTLGPKGSDGATYLGMMRHNQKVLVKGFACERT
jgi:ABC-type Zn uptake system ZnuABC Zn-binding protein ZnuA